MYELDKDMGRVIPAVESAPSVFNAKPGLLVPVARDPIELQAGPITRDGEDREMQDTPGGFAGLFRLWVAPLGRITGGLAGMIGLGEPVLSRPVPSRQGLPLPGVFSAARLDSIARRVAAQRSSIAALQAQLAALDEQLAVLEGMVGPLAEWSKTWAEFERLVLNPRRDRGAEG